MPRVESNTYPIDLIDIDRWLTWKETDGRKIPRAPYAHPEHPDRYVDAQDPDVWTDFATAQEWAAKLAGFELAYVIRNRDTFPDEDLVLIDYDEVRIPERGEIHPIVREHIEAAGSYADVSTSGTGVHILCRGGLPDGVKTMSDDLPAADGFPDAEIEVYDSAQFIAMTGQHIRATPAETATCQSFIDDLATEFATVTASRPDTMRDDPATPKAELEELDTTTDIQDIYDAIRQTRPADVRLRSTVTEERSDDSKSLDPSWTHSTSGTRLAEVDDGWIYRDGMIKLDALQVVALEEGIIADERDYPSGEAFQEAVAALRERGAHIPEYEPTDDVVAARGTRPGDDGVADSAMAAERSSTTEQVYRDEKCRVLESTIDEQRSTIERQRATIDRQAARIEELQTDLDELRVTLDQRPPETGRTGPDRGEGPGLGLWDRLQRWFADR